MKRERDRLSGLPDEEYWRRRLEEGWRPVAVEWERSQGEDAVVEPAGEAPPYGLRLAPASARLEADRGETEALALMLDEIAADHSLAEVAAALNRRGLATREGRAWTQVEVFHLLPRLVEASPDLSRRPA